MMVDVVDGRTERISSILMAVRRLETVGHQRIEREECLPGWMVNSKRSVPVMVKEKDG